MCGIIACASDQPVAPILLSGLKRLEYRGYDSSGIAIHHRNKLRVLKAAGKLSALEAIVSPDQKGTVGMGHTRWATHGEPTDQNAHPHMDPEKRIAVIHNGIVENAAALRERLAAPSLKFESETDTEVLAHLIASTEGKTLLERVRLALAQVQGTYGLVVMDTSDPETLVAARNGSPVILGISKDAHFVTSDAAAIAPWTREVLHLDDGELAAVSRNGFELTTLDAGKPERTATVLKGTAEIADRGDYPHFMLKEIMEQPEAVGRTLSGRLDHRFHTARLGGLNLTPRELLDVRRIKILGCGSAYYAGISGAGLIETLARLPADAEPAAEFRYRNPLIEPDTLYIVVSQSGETFDTLAALREIKRKGGRVIGVCNVVGSTIAREVDGGIYMHAGTEVSVASTKAYSCMLTCFMLLALMLGRVRDLSPQQGGVLVQALESLPEVIRIATDQSEQIETVAKRHAGARSAFFIGRTDAWPVALEGAQKLKEVSYIHAEAYPASELKHGPLALIDPETPTVVVLPDNPLLDKSLSSLQEIRARSGPVIALTNSDNPEIPGLATDIIQSPQCDPFLHPLVMGISLQLFAYHVAIANDRDVDQPRNLAKSVTVE